MGLLSSFPSQKKVFDKMQQKKLEYDALVKKCEEIQIQSQQQQHEQHMEEQRLLREQQQKKHQHHHEDMLPLPAMLAGDEDDLFGNNTLSARERREKEARRKAAKKKDKNYVPHFATSASAPAVPVKQPKTFYEQPISSFKSLAPKAPEMLANWRAQRAATFVVNQALKKKSLDSTAGGSASADALDGLGNEQLAAVLLPPPQREVGSVPFRPAGLQPHRDMKAASSSGSKSRLSHSGSGVMDMQLLMRELQTTEAAIADQKNKLSAAAFNRSLK